MKLFTKEQQESHENAKISYISKRKFENNYERLLPLYRRIRDPAHSISNLKYSPPKKIPIAFHNVSNYDYHFIIKELTEEFKEQFTCLAKNTEKYITLTIPLEKQVTRTDKN